MTDERKALDLLAGLHPGLTTDDPAQMAERIFEHVMSEYTEWAREKANYERNIELRNSILTAKRAAPDDARDAARYRWLRDTSDAVWRPFGLRHGGNAIKADAAIDAAMGESPGE